jgi:hypothetical protein
MQGGRTQEVTVDPNSDIIESHMVGGPTRNQTRVSQGALSVNPAPSAADLARQDLMDLEQNY